jgi:hypothetical protein
MPFEEEEKVPEASYEELLPKEDSVWPEFELRSPQLELSFNQEDHFP